MKAQCGQPVEWSDNLRQIIEGGVKYGCRVIKQGWN